MVVVVPVVSCCRGVPVIVVSSWCGGGVAVVMMRYCCGGGGPSCCGSGVVAVMSPRLWSCGGEGVAVVCEGDLERDGDSGCHRWSVWRLTFLASLRRGGDHGSWGW